MVKLEIGGMVLRETKFEDKSVWKLMEVVLGRYYVPFGSVRCWRHLRKQKRLRQGIFKGESDSWDFVEKSGMTMCNLIYPSLGR